MLESIKIVDFKSYKTQVLPLSSLTLMIGANASGKSNAIEAFRFLSWLAQGIKLSTLQTVRNSDEYVSVLRGHLFQLGRHRVKKFGIGCRLVNQELNEWNNLEVEFEIRENELHLAQERIFSSELNNSVPLYEIVKPASGVNTDVKVAYNNFARGGKKPQVICNDQLSIMSQLLGSARFSAEDKHAQQVIPFVTKTFSSALENCIFLDAIPAKMREESLPNTKLYENGSNLAGVLASLTQFGKDQVQKQKLIEFIQSLPEQDIRDITFFENRKGEISFELVESFGNDIRHCDQEVLSDGTLRVLAIAAALFSAKEGSTVVIEEIDNGVHPSRAKLLLSQMQKCAKERHLQLLLSTHNPALMNALPDEAVKDVVFCYRDPQEGDSRLVKLSELDNYLSLLAQGELGDLVTKGILERGVKQPETIEERKQKALAWLDQLQRG